MRAFIAIEIPAQVRSHLSSCAAELKALPVEASWTRPAGIHLTLRFLGEIRPEQKETVAKAMRQAAAGITPFRLELQGLGAFPNLNRPRVLWAGLGGETEAAARLQRNLESSLEEAGFPREERPWKPHLTLARIQHLADPRRFAAGVAACHLPPAAFEVSRIVLFQSELHPTGARYTELAAAALSA